MKFIGYVILFRFQERRLSLPNVRATQRLHLCYTCNSPVFYCTSVDRLNSSRASVVFKALSHGIRVNDINMKLFYSEDLYSLKSQDLKTLWTGFLCALLWIIAADHNIIM